ncbi:uncharacterized protein LOC6558437 [Drosophila grimshawi]|uniref:uncharacterized protein LOC6558437 n=1 Tax=Drosophila grimshawi TaxID=7222 RepID=UPI0013EEECBD|nr:uncharacterized protein LOC6558437 [Drosophila grimshawi]
MQFAQQPQSMQWKIAFLIIALVGDVSCIRNADGNDEQKHISAKLKNFFPSEPLPEVSPSRRQKAEISARVTNGGFRPSQMVEFTPSDVMQGDIQHRYPPSYLEPDYKYQVSSTSASLQQQQSAFDKQFSFPDETNTFHSYGSTQIPTTPVVSYLDPYRYTATPPTHSYIQNDQTYTVQSSLLVGSHAPQRPPQDEVYLKRPGYVFDESPSTFYRRPAAAATTPSSNKISYDSHDYPPPSYASQHTSNFKPQQSLQRPIYQRQDISGHRPQYATSSNYANNLGNYLQRPQPSYASHSSPSSSFSSNSQSPSSPPHYQYEPQQQQHQQQQQQHQQRPGHNYYEYQIGEIPPQTQQQHQQQQFNYRPALQATYRPPYQYQQHPQQQTQQQPSSGLGSGGLATLASLYAPQFTNLLLGGGTASTSSSPLGSLLGAFTGAQQHTQQHSRPPNTQLIRALENIARNDDLQCVPKVLCQMIAGQTLRGQLPGFMTSPAITNFLAGFPVASPALIYGRAALLGISGGERSCVQTYEKCPKNEMEIIHYLNNHRGGFFKFFSEPEEQPATLAQQSGDSGGSSLFSILSALTGGGQGLGLGQGQGQVTRTTPRPVARPTQRPSTDIANGIGSFFTQVLSEYLNGVEYQRRRRRRSLLPTEIKRSIQTDNGRLMPLDFHDEEDDLDTQTPVRFQDDDEAEAAQAHTELIGVLQFPEDAGEGRILHFKNIESEEHNNNNDNGAVRFPEDQNDSQSKVIYEFNRVAAQRKLRFPQDQDEAKRQQLTEGWAAVLPNGLALEDYSVEKRRGKRIVFKDTNQHLDELSDERLREEQIAEEADRLREEQLREAWLREEQQSVREEQLREEQVREARLREEQQDQREQHAPLNAVYEESAPPQRGARVLFPDHYERHIRRGKILNRPTYAPTYDYNNRAEEKEQRFVVSDEHRPSSYYRLEETSTDYQTSAQHSFMNYGEYMPGNTVRFSDSNDTPTYNPHYNPHYNYPNANYISDNRYSSAYQTTSTRRPKHEDDKNIYVNNSKGVTEYYIKPDGRKVYLGSG